MNRRSLRLAAVCLLALCALARVARGRGAVAVAIDYPAGLRGTFCVKLEKRATAGARAARLVRSRFESGIPAGRRGD